MSDQLDYQIHGDDLQVIEITLDPDEGVRAEVGAMMYMEEGIKMNTRVEGGIFSGLKRLVTGEKFFVSTFENKGRERAKVAFAAPYPGKIISLQ